MGQKKHKQSESTTETTAPAPFIGSNASVDPTLASLFESSVSGNSLAFLSEEGAPMANTL